MSLRRKIGTAGVGGAARTIQRPYENEVLADSPFAYWKLGETSGTTAADSAGTRNGTYTGGCTLAVETTPRGNAVEFNGSSGYVTTGVTGDSWNFSAWTLECWAKFTPVPLIDTVSCLMTLSYPGTGVIDMVMGLDLDATGASHAGMFAGGIYNSGFKIATATDQIGAGIWRHFVTTWSAGVATLFMDGTQRAQTSTGSSTAAPTTNPSLYLAHKWDTSAVQFVPCRMQHAAVYNSALSSTRVAAHYAAGATGP